MNQITINAQGKIVGRLASRIAFLLQGKNSAAYRPERRESGGVYVYNVDGVQMSGNKMSAYRIHHTGYPGGIKRMPVKNIHERDSRILLREAVLGMLARNRLRSRLIKRLTMVRGPLSGAKIARKDS